MGQSVNRYKADLRELQFVLFELFQIQDWLGKEPFGEWGQGECKMVLDETYRFVSEHIGPLNRSGDLEGCLLEDGQVKTPTGFKEAWTKLYESGWRHLGVPEKYNGQGAPSVLAAMVEEMLSGANTAFNMYPGLTLGAAELLAECGSAEQQKKFAQPLFDGKWGGTMCLSEPHAGSDVGAASTAAIRRDDGTYGIRGTKIWISSGDHDLTENIIHLVLARIDGAQPGTRGLSLFIVPKFRVNDDGSLGERNDVNVGSIEHKLGIHGSSTCVLNFGENDACVGELVGSVEHVGMKQMFTMMNYARIGVGIQGLAIASTAYLNTLAYAKERKQGPSVKNWKDPGAPKVPIIEHANVRQMLIEMKAKVEGMRALICKLTNHRDLANVLRGKDDERVAYHEGQVDLLTPVVKAYCSDEAFHLCELAIQVHGGTGYVQDYPIEQYLRDSKIFSIYEGTNSIQSLDLVGRKLGASGGQYAQEYLTDIQSFIDTHRDHDVLGPSLELLGKSQEAVAGSAFLFAQWFQAGEVHRVPLTARTFLQMLSELTVGWLLLQSAVVALEKLKDVAEDHPDHAFYKGKQHVAVWFAHNVLPDVIGRARTMASGDKSAVEIPEAAFSAL